MKVKTSVSISEDVLRQIDDATIEGESRSEYIEQVLKRHFRLKRREERNRRESEALQRLLETPGFESDVLDYSIDPFELGDDVETIDPVPESAAQRRMAG